MDGHQLGEKKDDLKSDSSRWAKVARDGLSKGGGILFRPSSKSYRVCVCVCVRRLQSAYKILFVFVSHFFNNQSDFAPHSARIKKNSQKLIMEDGGRVRRRQVNDKASKMMRARTYTVKMTL